MKLDEFKNYCLKLTEYLERYYYSSEPILKRTTTYYYDIEVGNEISSDCITISELITDNDEINGFRIQYYNGHDIENQKEDITFDKPAKIRIITGNPERFFVSKYTFEIVKRDENTKISKPMFSAKSNDNKKSDNS